MQKNEGGGSSLMVDPSMATRCKSMEVSGICQIVPAVACSSITAGRYFSSLLALRSSGLTPFGGSRPSFDSGPYAPYRREPLMSHVRRHSSKFSIAHTLFFIDYLYFFNSASRRLMSMRITLWIVFALPLAAMGQQSNSLQGKWMGTLTGNSGGKFIVELVVAQSTGTWRFIARGNQARGNPCLGKVFPVVVTSESEAEIRFTVNSSSVVPGCIDQVAVLKSTGANSLEGEIADGRVVKLSRP
jgi:hypothetical protein